MGNAWDIDNNQCVGYCSIVPAVGEEHLFGEKAYVFVKEHNGLLYFKEKAI